MFLLTRVYSSYTSQKQYFIFLFCDLIFLAGELRNLQDHLIDKLSLHMTQQIDTEDLRIAEAQRQGEAKREKQEQVSNYRTVDNLKILSTWPKVFEQLESLGHLCHKWLTIGT